ncbi:MAG: hypothetical protein BSOLF_1867 [Candidatus Carbobacillus altaicus]|uniref:Uncharacterized protein n=1 Tax=Candidatus Carbonibacillus altaicus TaxID=2163959 RepID=A0A2R6Y3Q6_9BACL|nr:MAG: hypothetical protein BSOLF_1867 [Candidatus Carbobacillus altaicus]
MRAPEAPLELVLALVSVLAMVWVLVMVRVLEMETRFLSLSL